MPEPKLVTVAYKCGHTVNILSPGVSDPEGILQCAADPKYDRLCWNCDSEAAYLVQVPSEVTETLRKAKKGE